MDMNALEMGPAAPPSGLIIPWCPEDAARVRTTSTAQGVCNVIFLILFFSNVLWV